MIKPRPPHQAADKFLRLAKLAVTLGMEFEDAAIGVDHELIAGIGPALPRLSSALQTLSQDMRRQAMTPPPEPPPIPKPTPILDFLESKEKAAPDEKKSPAGLADGYDEMWNSLRADEAHPKVPAAHADPEGLTPTWVAYGGRNPLFYLAANSEDVALAMIEAEIPGHGCTVQCQGWDFIESRSVPSFGKWNAAQAEKCREAAAPKAKRPRPAKPEPGEKLGKRQCWIAKVAGRPAFRIYAHAKELAEGQLAHKVPRDSWPEASIALEFTNRSQDFNGVPMLSDLSPERARGQVLLLLAEAEHESGSGFVAPMPEEPPAEDDDQAEVQPQTLVAKHRPTGDRLFTIVAPGEEAARDYIGMTLTADQLEEIDLFSDEDVSALGLPDWEEFDLDTWPADDTPPTSPAPVGPAFPTESPRDPLATLPVEELGIRKPLCGQIVAKGIRFAAHLEEELGGDLLGDVIASQEQEEHVRRQIRKWETDRALRMAANGSWLEEELTHASFRLGDAPAFWAGLRDRGASDRELRDAINSMFPHRINHGWGVHYRVGSHFVRGTAPAFYRGGGVPKRDDEPALEGKHLVDAVRRLLAIPTREEPAAKAPAKRKAVKA